MKFDSNPANELFLGTSKSCRIKLKVYCKSNSTKRTRFLKQKKKTTKVLSLSLCPKTFSNSRC
eukprot:UN28294